MIFCLNSRQVDITENLIQTNKPLSINEIASTYGVSTRTIRYDIELVERWLNENKSSIIKVPKKGVILNTNCEKSILLDKLKTLSIENRVLSDAEKIKYIILELFMSNNPLSIDTLCNRLFFSRNTIMKILKDTNSYLGKYELQLYKSSKGGFSIIGEEPNLRRLILTIFMDVIDYESLCKLLREDENDDEMKNSLSNFDSFINIQRMKMLSKNFIEIEENYNYYITDMNFIRLIVYIEISLKRLKEGHIITQYSETLTKTIEYKIACEINSKITSSKLEIGEIAEIAKYIIESKSFNTLNELKRLSVHDIADKEVIDITNKLIKYIEEKININVKANNQLYNGLILHMRSAIPRIRNNNQMSNNYLNEIKENYPYIFQSVKESVESMRVDFANEVNDSEIGYIAIHIRACYEKYFEKVNRFSALVVCEEGISFLNILTTKICKEFPNIKLIGTCSIYDYERYKEEIDFIISTKIFLANDIDVIVVNPFLYNKDIYSINEVINQLNKFKLIYKYNTQTKERRFLMLKDIIEKDSIRTQVEAENWEDAVIKAGSILVNKNMIKEQYIKNMIEAVKDLGPYIVVMPGIAFAHSKPDESVLKTSMSMITLKNPVNFGSKQNDPVKIIFVFAAEDGNKHILALQDLAKFLSVDSNVQYLLNSNDCSAIYERLINN